MANQQLETSLFQKPRNACLDMSIFYSFPLINYMPEGVHTFTSQLVNKHAELAKTDLSCTSVVATQSLKPNVSASFNWL